MKDKPRFETTKLILHECAIFALIDKKENKIVCHFNWENGEAYCEEMASKIVEVLNNQTNDTVTA